MSATARMQQTLTDRYVHATLREVPEARHQDLGRELRSTIEDMVEARLDQGEPRQAAETAVLIELGDPSALAAQYTGARLQLLGPKFYLTWKRLVLQLLMIVPAVIGVLVAAVGAIEGEAAVGEVVVDALGAAVGTAMQIVFWTTLVFVILDRVDAEVPGEWTPDRLPEAPAAREYSFGDAATGIGWNLVVAALLVLQHFRSWVPGPDGEDVAVLDPDLWHFWIPFLLVVTAVVIALEVWKYRRGWTIGAVVGVVVTSLAFSVPVAWLATEDRLLNPAFVEAVGLGSQSLDSVNLAIAVGAVVVLLWEVGEAVVKGVVHGRR